MYNQLEGYTKEEYNEKKKVNEPEMMAGMVKVMFKEATKEGEKAQVIKQGEAGFDEENWYNYEEKKWANGVTKDGSMWVWIPRYAYKITYTNPSDKSKGGTIDIKFLIGTTDNYYDDSGEMKTAQRQKTKDQVIDTTKDYTVHPAFTNESNIDFANGGWDKELRRNMGSKV